jgi:hypothetical protein
MTSSIITVLVERGYDHVVPGKNQWSGTGTFLHDSQKSKTGPLLYNELVRPGNRPCIRIKK